MRDTAETWAVVLAGGDGSRLRALTTTREGLTVPKQYCSLGRSTCLLQEALVRAEAVALPSHICAVVAAQHRRWWEAAAAGVKSSNLFVQPQNKGTAHGILLALLLLERINPDAQVTLLPADHHFRDETTISRLLRVAVNLANADPAATYLLGAEPDAPDGELGYILPAERVRDKAASITGFAEKPDPDYARELISLGALWNLFILIGTVHSLLDLYAEKHARSVTDMRKALADQAAHDTHALTHLYDRLAPVDFSHDILEIQATRLKVLRVPNCGWTDLGTPQRVDTTLRNMVTLGQREPRSGSPLFFDLYAARQGP